MYNKVNLIRQGKSMTTCLDKILLKFLVRFLIIDIQITWLICLMSALKCSQYHIKKKIKKIAHLSADEIFPCWEFPTKIVTGNFTENVNKISKEALKHTVFITLLSLE